MTGDRNGSNAARHSTRQNLCAGVLAASGWTQPESQDRGRALDDQHDTGHQNKHQHDTAEGSFVKTAEQFQAKPGAGEQGR
jgi:hypothetical protein